MLHLTHRSERSTHMAGVTAALAGAVVLVLTATPLRATDKTTEAGRITESIEVLEGLVATPDEAIPRYILDRAEAIIVIPTLVKGGFVVGAEHGKGVMSVRDEKARRWSLPSFVTMTGGSIGWQVGLQAIDLVLVVMNRDGIDDLLQSQFTLGAHASVAAGPVGRSAEAATDAKMGAKILAYSRARGVFAGATLEGSTLRTDADANRRFYGTEISASSLLEAAHAPVSVPMVGERWRETLARVAGTPVGSR